MSRKNKGKPRGKSFTGAEDTRRGPTIQENLAAKKQAEQAECERLQREIARLTQELQAKTPDRALLGPEPAPEGMPQHLFDMRAVMERDDPAGDRGGQQRFFREMRNKRPTEFFAELRKAEAEYAEKKIKEEQGDMDEGTKRAMELLDQLFEKYK